MFKISFRRLAPFFFSILVVFGMGRQNLHAQSAYEWRVSYDSLDFECLAFNPLSHGQTIFAASQSVNGILRSDDAGKTWKLYSSGFPQTFAPNLFHILCLAVDTNIVFAVSNSGGERGGFFKSTNGGKDWTTPLDTISTTINGGDVAYDPNTNTIYYSESNRNIFYMSSDHGNTWTHTVNDTFTFVSLLCSLAISPDSKVLLEGANNGTISRSTDGGATWKTTASKYLDSTTILGGEIPRIVFSTSAPQTVMAIHWLSFDTILANDSSLLLSTDAGLTWSNISAHQKVDSGLWAFEIDQRPDQVVNNRPQHFWLGFFPQWPMSPTFNAPFGPIQETFDGGQTYKSVNFPIDTLMKEIWMLKYDESSGLLAAATDRGIYVSPTRPFAVKSPAASIAQKLVLSQNPFSTRTTISWPGIESAGANLKVLDLLGRTVYQRRLKGESSLLLERSAMAGAIANGGYSVELATPNGEIARTKLICLP